MDTHVRARTTWYRIVALINRNQKDLADSMIEIIEAEIRATQHATLLEAAKLVLAKADPAAAARTLRDRADQVVESKRGSRLDSSQRGR